MVSTDHPANLHGRDVVTSVSAKKLMLNDMERR